MRRAVAFWLVGSRTILPAFLRVSKMPSSAITFARKMVRALSQGRQKRSFPSANWMASEISQISPLVSCSGRSMARSHRRRPQTAKSFSALSFCRFAEQSVLFSLRLHGQRKSGFGLLIDFVILPGTRLPLQRKERCEFCEAGTEHKGAVEPA